MKENDLATVEDNSEVVDTTTVQSNNDHQIALQFQSTTLVLRFNQRS